MSKTKHCPKCGAKTRGCFWSSKRITATNAAGQVLVHPNGQAAQGYPTRKCSKCDWRGDFLISPPAPRPPLDLLEDNDEDYINHYYH